MTTPDEATPAPTTGRADRLRRSPVAAFSVGTGVGVLGGMIGLGGAEFRLPLLIGLLGFIALQAVVVNKAMSLAVVLTALPARLVAVPYTALASHWLVAVNLLAGSLAGAWAGASWATRMRAAVLHKVLAVLLVLMAAALMFTHLDGPPHSLGLHGPAQAVMGVAGGELLIATIVLLCGIDIKLAAGTPFNVSSTRSCTPRAGSSGRRSGGRPDAPGSR